MKHKIKALLAKRPYRRVKPEDSLREAIDNIPRITNETVAEHREEVLGSARKLIYPLQHSLRRIVTISGVMFTVLAVGLLVYCILALYRFGSASTFMYRVTEVIPFPVARIGSHFVAYENYLFELRRYVHYYQTQRSDSGEQQLLAFRKEALDIVITDTYVKQLAAKHKVSVSDRELNDQITLLRNQNRLGGNDAVFEDVLREFWGWSLGDFKRKLRQQMLAQKVVSALDTETHNRAQEVLTKLTNGGDFAALAKEYSMDPDTKDAGGDYGISIEQTNRRLAPQTIDALFKLQPNQNSGIIETPLGLEILRVTEKDGNTVRASHIYLAFKNISTYVEPLKQQKKPHNFITP